LGLKIAFKLNYSILYHYAINNIQCCNINVITLDPLWLCQKPAKNPMQKLPKNPQAKTC
jgi:hypothetical protein